jgi:type II secretory pathway component GspD/PulD (secretin)
MCQLSQVPIETALQTVLKGTKYAFRKIPKSYLVYMPVTNTWVESELRTVLQDISSAVGVVIIADEAVSGLVSAELKDVPLDTALEIILSGTGFVVKKTPYYYLVSSSAPDAASFPNVSETRTVKLNYMPADKAITLLAAAFKRYVQAVTDTYTVSITAPPVLADRIVADLRDIDRKPRHVMLDARVVVMERGDLLNLGVEWGWPKISAGIFGGTPEIEATTGRTLAKWPWGVQIGYSSDKTFTDALLLTLNMLSENSELDIIATPQVLAQDGKVAEMRVVTEEYYYMTPPGATSIYTYGELKTVESGTILNITPRIGDNNDITLEMSVEVSDSIPAGRGSDLPVVTRRTAQNTVRIKDGGTVALAGLSENRGRSTKKSVPGLSELPLVGGLFVYDNTDKATRQVAVFVTANIVPDDEKLLEQLAAEPAWQEVQAKPVGEEFKLSLKESLSRQPK